MPLRWRAGDTRAWASSFTRIYCSQQQAPGMRVESKGEGPGKDSFQGQPLSKKAPGLSVPT